MLSSAIQKLASERCVPCSGIPRLTIDEAKESLKVLPQWTLLDSRIEREFRFKTYMDGLNFAYSIGKVAESEDHHPEVTIGWRRVKLIWTTHSLKGLSHNDLVMAAKSELEYEKNKSP